MAVTQVGTPTAPVQVTTVGSASVTGTFSGSQPRTAGDLLIAWVTSYGATSTTLAANSGAWMCVAGELTSSVCMTSFWQRTATGADTAPTFTATTAGATARMTCSLFEFTGQSGLNPIAGNGLTNGTTGTLTTTTQGTVGVIGSYALAGWNIVSATGTATWTPATSWTNGASTASTSTTDHAYVDYYAGPPTGSALTEAPTQNLTTTVWSTIIIIIQPPALMALGQDYVVATAAGLAQYGGIGIQVSVLTGASSGFGNTATSVAVTTPQLAITPTYTGSLVYGALNNAIAATAFTADTDSTFTMNLAESSVGATFGAFYDPAATTAATPITVGASAPTTTAAYAGIALLEVRQGTGQTLAQNAASTAGTGYQFTSVAASPAFMPPPGSLLLAIISTAYVATSGTAVTMAVEDYMGLTWSQRVSAAGPSSGYAGIFTAVVPPIGYQPVVTRQAVKRASLW